MRRQVMLGLYFLRVYSIAGFYIITYALGIYLLHLLCVSPTRMLVLGFGASGHLGTGSTSQARTSRLPPPDTRVVAALAVAALAWPAPTAVWRPRCADLSRAHAALASFRPRRTSIGARTHAHGGARLALPAYAGAPKAALQC